MANLDPGTLDLSDPLWRKLDNAYGYPDVPDQLRSLAETWDTAQMDDLLFGSLIHQETCYSAAYAAVPHLLAIAEPVRNLQQRRDIALFLGHLAQCSLRNAPHANLTASHLPGLPFSLAEWNERRGVYRRLVSQLEASSHGSLSESNAVDRLAQYRMFLAVTPPNETDFKRFFEIGQSFIDSLTHIGDLCKRVVFETAEDKDAPRHMLYGLAASRRLHDLAQFLDTGSEGQIFCATCGERFEYLQFRERDWLSTCQVLAKGELTTTRFLTGKKVTQNVPMDLLYLFPA